jgi:hypothetical protein
MLSTRTALPILIGFVVLGFALMTPTAAAQQPIGDVGETVGDTIADPGSEATDPVTGVVDGAVEGAPGIVDGAADSAIETVTGTTDTVTDTVTGAAETVTDVVEDTTQAVTGPIEDVVDTVTDTVEDTVDTVTDTVEDTTEEATDTVADAEETVDEVVGPQPEGSEPSRNDGRPGVQTSGAADGSSEGAISHPGNPPSGSRAPHDGGVNRPEGRAALPRHRIDHNGLFRGRPVNPRMTRERGRAADTPVIRPTSVAEARTEDRPSESGDSILRRVAEAAKHPAFPLLLALVVMGYVAFQNRVDRKDPKLAAAAVDTEQELMRFE